MNNYVTELNLDYDPFEPRAAARIFFEGGERRLLVEQIIQRFAEGSTLVAITGSLGSGKSTLAREVRRCIGTDSVCIYITATLFMNQAQFLDAVGKQLPKHKHISAAPNPEVSVARLKQFSAELDLEAQSLILIVDDAQELGSEVLELIESLVQRSGKSCVQVILFGERQLRNLLQNTLTDETQAELVQFELPGLTTEDTLEYLQITLGTAGLKTPLPFSGRIVGEIQNLSNGMPAAINALAADFLMSGAVVTPDNLLAEPEDVPTGKISSFNAHDHMQFDLDIADVEAGEESLYADTEQEHQAEHADVRAVLLAYAANYRYALAASALSVVLVLTLLGWNTGTPPTSGISPAAVASNPGTGNANRIQLAPPVAAAVTADRLAAVAVATESPANALNVPEPVSAIAVPDTPVELADSVTVAEDAGPSGPPAQIALAPGPATITPDIKAPEVTALVKPAPAASAKLSAYEQQLLNFAAGSYTLQILGSHSEANVREFIAGKSLSELHGYYETRLQDKPWFVVVAGNYKDRAAAAAMIEQLPNALRDMQPWIRMVGDIQRDIRQLNKL